MNRQEDFIDAGIAYRMKHGKPMCIAGSNLADVERDFNRVMSFEEGAEHGYQYAVDKACEYISIHLGMALSCYPIDINVLVKDKFVSKFVDNIRNAMR